MRALVANTILAAGVVLSSIGNAAAKPLKVFVLAGQSNMQGHAKVATFEHLSMDPRTAPLLKEMRGHDGEPRVCENVWISAVGVAKEERYGRLTVGYGAEHRDLKIGPEFTFGIYMQKLLDEPILIIKTAWGGKSLHTDFRPPSMGVYQLNDGQKEQCRKKGQNVEAVQAERAKASGQSYRLMIEHIQNVLEDIGRVCPEYDSKQGYDLAGFVWFQGWNDMVDGGVYPERDKAGGYKGYSECLGAFIRDVRKDLSAPDMKFVTGVMGVNGPLERYENKRYKTTHGNFRKAMAAPARWRKFKGTVCNVYTADCWDVELGELDTRWEKVKNKSRSLNKDENRSPKERAEALKKFTAEWFTPEELELRSMAISNAAYHYLGSAKIMACIGKAFAEAMDELMEP